MIANSTGGLDDVVELVAAILAGKAVEVFGTDPDTGHISATGWQVLPAPGVVFAGGLAVEQATFTVGVGGPLRAER